MYTLRGIETKLMIFSYYPIKNIDQFYSLSITHIIPLSLRLRSRVYGDVKHMCTLASLGTDIRQAI